MDAKEEKQWHRPENGTCAVKGLYELLDGWQKSGWGWDEWSACVCARVYADTTNMCG